MNALLLCACLADTQAPLLLVHLGDRRFHVREAAQARLARLSPLLLPRLREARDKPPSEEVRRRLELLCAPWWREECAAAAERLRPAKGWPWLCISGEGYSGPAVWYYVNEVQSLGAGGGPDFMSFRLACRRWAEAQLVARVPLAQVAAELEWMACQEQQWRQWHAGPGAGP